MTARCAVLGVVGFSLALIVLSLIWGPIPLSIGEVWGGLTGTGTPTDSQIVRDIRLPRTLAAWLTGFGLGLAGAVMQGLLRNPLAEPGVLGISATASLGATLTILTGWAAQWSGAIPAGALAGALLATAILAYGAARVESVTALLLLGVGVSSVAGAMMSLATNLAPNPFSLAELLSWMMGSVANRSWPDLAVSALIMAVGLACVWSQRRALSALSLGEETAASLGVAIQTNRLILIIGTGLLVGACVALAGAIGFVGLVAAHVVRPWVRHDPGRVLLPAGLAGGLLLVLADMLVRILPTMNELNLGVVSALFGAPAFVWIAVQRGRHDD